MNYRIYKLIILIYFFLIFENKITEKYKKFEEWLLSNGAYISPKITPIELSNENRYIISNSSIEKGEKLLFIPNKVIISSLNDNVHKLCLQIFSFEDELNEFDCIVTYIAFQLKNNNSFFKPYFDYFPNINYNIPLYYSNDLINKYKILGLDNYLLIGLTKLEIIYQRAKKFYKNDTPDFSIFKDSMFYVSSRNFARINSTFFENMDSMVPYLDLLNHDYNHNTEFFHNDHDLGFYLYAKRKIEKGEEITDFYGNISNLNLFTIYGFTLKNNIKKIGIYLNFNNLIYSFHNIDEYSINSFIDNLMNKNKINLEQAIILSKNKLKKTIDNLYNIINDDINLIRIIEEEIETLKNFDYYLDKIIKKEIYLKK